MDLVSSRRSQHLNYLNQLVKTIIALEEWLPKKHFSQGTSSRPYIDSKRIACGTENELWGPVVSRANIIYIDGTCNQSFGRPKVSQLQVMSFRVD